VPASAGVLSWRELGGMAIRFIHTADWQLGKAFGGFGPDCGAHLRAQRLKTIRRLAELAAERQVDAVLVAGDVFDGQLVSEPILTGTVGAMQAFGGDWVLIAGNHDAAMLGSVWERVRALTAGSPKIHLAMDDQPVVLAHGELAVLPAALRRRQELDDRTAYWDQCPTPPGTCRVGLAHGSVPERLPEAADADNPVAADRAATARLDYLALGDWHGTFQINERTYYSGTPEPDRFKANDSGNVLLVEIPAPGALPKITPIAIGHYCWRQVERPLLSAGDIGALDHELDALEPKERHIVRLKLAGSLSLAERHRLEERLNWWRGQFSGVEVDQQELRVRAEAEDFASLDPPGYVAAAIEELRRRQAAGEAAAEEAVAILYGLCAGAGGTA